MNKNLSRKVGNVTKFRVVKSKLEQAQENLAGTKIFYGVAHAKLGRAYRDKLKVDAAYNVAKYTSVGLERTRKDKLKVDGAYNIAKDWVKKAESKYEQARSLFRGVGSTQMRSLLSGKFIRKSR